MLVQQHRPRRPRSRWPSLPRPQIRDERLLGLQRREDGCPMSTRRLSPCSTDRLERNQPQNKMLSVLTALALPSRTNLRASCCFRPVGEWPRRFSSARSASQLNSITKSSSHFSAGLNSGELLLLRHLTAASLRGAVRPAEPKPLLPLQLSSPPRSALWRLRSFPLAPLRCARVQLLWGHPLWCLPRRRGMRLTLLIGSDRRPSPA